MAKKTTVLGLDDLKKKLAALEKATAGEVLKAAFLEGGVILKEEAIERIPKDTGNAAESIKVVARRRGDKAQVEVGSNYFVANILEIGAQPHSIAPRKANQLRLEDGSFVSGAEHPGVPARPWLRPAYDAKEGEIIEAIKDALRKAILDAIK